MPGIRWGYAVNQWRVTEVDFVRRDQWESALKVMSVSGFRGVEIGDHTIGGAATVAAYFGSARGFLDFLHGCGVDRVCSFSSSLPGSPTNAGDHERIGASAKRTAAFLREVGGSCLVVRPMGSYWREAPVTEEKIKTAAECWNRVGKSTQEEGIQTTLHIDFLCGIHGQADIENLLKYTDPRLVGLAIDTAELAIAGVDPVELYDKHHDRVKHFHFKDATVADTLGEYKMANADSLLLAAGGKRGVERWFFEMGAPGGLVDFKALMASMKQHNYDGLVVVESDQSPHPEESVMLNGWYVKQVLAKV